MKPQLVGIALLAGVLWGSWLLSSASAQTAPPDPSSPPNPTSTEVTQTNPANPATAPAKSDEGKPVSNVSVKATHSPAVDEILKMVTAGVSMEVIKTYIDNSSRPFNLTAAEIIALKQSSVPDDVTTALVKRDATLKAQAIAAMQNGSARGNGSGVTPRRHMDPESYDYFHYYYLYPRTLAAANQRLYSYNSPFPSYPNFGSSFGGLLPYGYSFCGPPPFRPLPPSVFRSP